MWRDSNESRGFVPLLAHKHYIEHFSNFSYRFRGKLYRDNYRYRIIAQPYLVCIICSWLTLVMCICFTLTLSGSFNWYNIVGLWWSAVYSVLFWQPMTACHLLVLKQQPVVNYDQQMHTSYPPVVCGNPLLTQVCAQIFMFLILHIRFNPQEASGSPTPKRPRGRPKGSKNKPSSIASRGKVSRNVSVIL